MPYGRMLLLTSLFLPGMSCDGVESAAGKALQLTAEETSALSSTTPLFVDIEQSMRVIGVATGRAGDRGALVAAVGRPIREGALDALIRCSPEGDCLLQENGVFVRLDSLHHDAAGYHFVVTLAVTVRPHSAKPRICARRLWWDAVLRGGRWEFTPGSRTERC